MRGIMDEFTHLKNYDIPVDPGEFFVSPKASLKVELKSCGI
jgi:hypothetical protein